MTTYMDIFQAAIDPGDVERLLEVRDAALGKLRTRLPAFERAELVRLADGTWLDVLVWSAPDGDQQAMRLADEIPELREMHGLVRDVRRHERGTVEHAT